MSVTDTPEAFGQRIKSLAGSLGIGYPLDEQELAIKKVVFSFPGGSTKTFWADSTNKSSRAIVQHIAELSGLGGRLPVAQFLGDLETLYGFYWHDRPHTGVHPFIDAFKDGADEVRYYSGHAFLVEPESIINDAWENRADVSFETQGVIRDAVNHALGLLDRGEARVAEYDSGGWTVNQWLKKAVLLYFKLNDNVVMEGPGDTSWFDKVPSKFAGWNEAKFRAAGFRAVPGSIVRRGAHIGRSVVLMPSFVNIGAYVGDGTMIDTWATIGSCAQIGKNCHISGGAGIGGVLEPLQADPVIIGDGAFIGARAEIAEGVQVGEGAVISMGVYIGASTKIVDRETGKVHFGFVPPYAVVVPGSIGGGDGKPALGCVVIVKTVDAQTRGKTAINELLRD